MKLEVEFKNGKIKVMEVYQVEYDDEGISWERSVNVGDHEESLSKSISYENIASIEIDGEAVYLSEPESTVRAVKEAVRK